MDLVSEIRADSSIPIIVARVRKNAKDRVAALSRGAYDYLTKPFSPRELVARVKAIVRRSAYQVNSGESLEADGVSVNLRTRRASHNGSSLVLTATEFDLMAYLMARPGRVIERSELLENVWGYSEALGTRTVDVHIAQIRTKLGPNASIRTVRGVGYSWEAPTHDDAEMEYRHSSGVVDQRSCGDRDCDCGARVLSTCCF